MNGRQTFAITRSLFRDTAYRQACSETRHVEGSSRIDEPGTVRAGSAPLGAS